MRWDSCAAEQPCSCAVEQLCSCATAVSTSPACNACPLRRPAAPTSAARCSSHEQQHYKHRNAYPPGTAAACQWPAPEGCPPETCESACRTSTLPYRPLSSSKSCTAAQNTAKRQAGVWAGAGGREAGGGWQLTRQAGLNSRLCNPTRPMHQLQTGKEWAYACMQCLSSWQANAPPQVQPQSSPKPSRPTTCDWHMHVHATASHLDKQTWV